MIWWFWNITWEMCQTLKHLLHHLDNYTVMEGQSVKFDWICCNIDSANHRCELITQHYVMIAFLSQWTVSRPHEWCTFNVFTNYGNFSQVKASTLSHDVCDKVRFSFTLKIYTGQQNFFLTQKSLWLVYKM